MKEYVYSIVGAVLLSAVVISFIPEGKTAATIKSVAKTLCLLIIVTPVLSFFQKNAGASNSIYTTQINLEKIDIETDEEFIQYFSNEKVLWAQTQLEIELRERYGLNLTVTIDWEWRNRQELDEIQEVYIRQIRVQGAAKEAEVVKREILEYLTQNYCEEVLIE